MVSADIFLQLTAMNQIRTVVRQCYGWSMPYGVSINGEQDFDAKEDIRSMRLGQRLEMLACDLVIHGRLIREQFNRDLISSETDTFAAHYRV
jgi:FMN reductase